MEVQGRTVGEIFGSPDDLKFHSSMTLFANAAAICERHGVIREGGCAVWQNSGGLGRCVWRGLEEVLRWGDGPRDDAADLIGIGRLL